jgi:hypothetical protein
MKLVTDRTLQETAAWDYMMYYSLLRTASAAVPIFLLLLSTPLDTFDTRLRGTSCGLCSQAAPSTTNVSPEMNLQQRNHMQQVTDRSKQAGFSILPEHSLAVHCSGVWPLLDLPVSAGKPSIY